MSFEQAYEKWKIYATRRHKKQCFETLNQNFNKHVLPYFENTDILKCAYIKKYGSDLDFFIFGGKTPLSPTTIKRHKHKACTNRGIREITTHEFRHSCATRLIKKGMSMDKVSKLLGHSSIAITMDIYVHNEKRDWLSLLSKLDFFQTLNQNFKKILTSIITHFV